MSDCTLISIGFSCSMVVGLCIIWKENNGHTCNLPPLSSLLPSVLKNVTRFGKSPSFCPKAGERERSVCTHSSCSAATRVSSSDVKGR